TLTKLKLLEATGDNEAMTGEEVLKRLELGYHVALRQSSIRQDLRNQLKAVLAQGITQFDQMMYTTDGSAPSFIEHGLINQCIAIAIEEGVPLEEAYRMATYNVAKYYGLDEVIGSIALSRLANYNIISEQNDHNTCNVFAKQQ